MKNKNEVQELAKEGMGEEGGGRREAVSKEKELEVTSYCY